MEQPERGRTPTAHQLLMIEKQLVPDFLDDLLEWRRLFSEIWGTFLLVLVAAGGGVVGAMSKGRVNLGMMVVAPGIMVMAIIYFMGPVSGAHLNPAVTLAFAVRRNFPWKRVPGYTRFDRFLFRTGITGVGKNWLSNEQDCGIRSLHTDPIG